MRSYNQYCAVAKALDLVGDRWTLLIIRELLLRDRCRYTDLQFGLPGIATNLLADRLRDLEENGLVRRIDAPPPIATTLYELTPRGRDVKPILDALGHWGVAQMVVPHEQDTFRSHWLAYPVRELLTDRSPSDPPVTIAVHTGESEMIIETAGGGALARQGVAEGPDAVLTGPPGPILGLLTGVLDLEQAKSRGLTFEGDMTAIRRVQPVATRA
jgi:DNA-binding HxlR family transcriptional regulator